MNAQLFDATLGVRHAENRLRNRIFASLTEYINKEEILIKQQKRNEINKAASWEKKT